MIKEEKNKNGKKIIVRAKSGCVESFEELMEINAEKMYGLSLMLTQNDMEAQDLVQDVFIKALKNIKRFNEKADFSTWLYRITHNLWIDRYRRKKRVEFVPLNEDHDNCDPIPDPEDILANKELKKTFIKGINTLSPKEKVTVLLIIYDGKSYKEVAGICRCSIGTVGSRLSRGLNKLSKYIKRGMNQNEM